MQTDLSQLIDVLNATTASERRRVFVGAPLVGLAFFGVVYAVAKGTTDYRLTVGAAVGGFLALVVLVMGLRAAGGDWAKRPLLVALRDNPQRVTRWRATEIVIQSRHTHTQFEVDLDGHTPVSLTVMAEVADVVVATLRRVAPQAEARA